MELLVGPNFTIDVPSSPPRPAYGGDHPNADADERAVPYALFDGGSDYRLGGKPEFFAGESSESSSSIGTPDDSDNENGDVSSEVKEEEEVQSKLKGSTSLDSLEDSLPIEKGLSSHFIGKSKSFTDLSQVSNVKELQKQENPFNKRRRVLIASKWSRRSFYSWSNPKSMPLLPVDEDEDDDYDDDDVEEDKARKVSPSSSLEEEKPENQIKLREVNNRVPQSYAAHMRLRLGSFKSRSFSLADLQEHEDEEEEDNYD